MGHPLLSFVELVAPVILGTLLLLLQFCCRKAEGRATKYQFSLFGLITIEKEIHNIIVLRVLISLFAVVCFTLPAFKDYTKFFPTHFRMEVFFDDLGIEKTLAQFNHKELEQLAIEKDWPPLKAEYLNMLNTTVEGQVGSPFRFDGERGVVHSKGETYFTVRKVQGWQKYQIEEAGGSLTHTFEMPGKEPQRLSSKFELLETDANRIQVSLADIYFRYTKVLNPEFKQVVSLSPTRDLYHHRLIAVTKLRFFPVVDIGRTIYICHLKGTTKRIPIGYALYTPD